MRNYYEKGDEVKIHPFSRVTINICLRDYSYKDEKGRTTILQDIISHPVGTVKGIKQGTGHLEVLYQPKGKTHSWWLPTNIIKPLNN